MDARASTSGEMDHGACEGPKTRARGHEDGGGMQEHVQWFWRPLWAGERRLEHQIRADKSTSSKAPT